MEKLLTINEVSEILQVPKGSIYNLVHEDKIPHIKIGKGRLRFRKSSLEKWVEKLEQEERTQVKADL